MVFQSTHPTRGCDSDGYYLSGVSPISIHAPHVGVRQGGVKNFHRGCISIHAPHEGVRLRGKVRHGDNNKFQSTHPTRGCDHFLEYFVISFQFQSTHPTRGCDKEDPEGHGRAEISIHAPHEGVRLFVGRSVSAGISDISIHAPHEGVRRFPMTNRDRLIISIHAPHEGVRQANAWREPNAWQFQSTHPTRGCDGRGRP